MELALQVRAEQAVVEPESTPEPEVEEEPVVEEAAEA